MRQKVLFLCTGNSCRSQMAEGFARVLRQRDIEPYSAGIERHGLNPNAITVMSEVGVDISRQQSQTVEEFSDKEFDLVVTVCEHADHHCPSFQGGPRIVHVGFPDPPALAKQKQTEKEALDCYRHVRDEIRDFILAWQLSN